MRWISRSGPNTPLIARAEGSFSGHSKRQTKLLLCHDYRGGYHDYKGIGPGALEEELYSCAHLQYIDSFIYFARKLVCVPLAIWWNLCQKIYKEDHSLADSIHSNIGRRAVDLYSGLQKVKQ